MAPVTPFTFPKKKKKLHPKSLSMAILHFKPKKKKSYNFRGEKLNEMEACRHQSHHQNPPMESHSQGLTLQCQS